MKKNKHPFLYALIRRGIVLLLLVMMILTIYEQSSGTLFSPESTLSRLITPVQSLVSRVTQSVSGYLYRVKLRSNIEYEYNQLKAQNGIDEKLVHDHFPGVIRDVKHPLRPLERLFQQRRIVHGQRPGGRRRKHRFERLVIVGRRVDDVSRNGVADGHFQRIFRWNLSVVNKF